MRLEFEKLVADQYSLIEALKEECSLLADKLEEERIRNKFVYVLILFILKFTVQRQK